MFLYIFPEANDINVDFFFLQLLSKPNQLIQCLIYPIGKHDIPYFFAIIINRTSNKCYYPHLLVLVLTMLQHQLVRTNNQYTYGVTSFRLTRAIDKPVCNLMFPSGSSL